MDKTTSRRRAAAARPGAEPLGGLMARAGGSDPREPWPLLPVLSAYLGCVLLMTWPWIAGLVTIPWDAKAHFQPQIQFLADSLARGEWPWWNPFVFAGTPQVADPQSMIFSPPFLVLALLDRAPSLWAADMTVIASMSVGGIGMLVYIRDRGWHWGGALIAAIVFTFGAAMAWRIQHTGQVLSLAYLPWALLALERALARGSVLNGIGAGIVGAAIVLGRDQVALLCVYLLAARALWLWATADAPGALIRRSLLPLISGGVVGLLLVAIPVLMTVLLAGDSNRPTIDFEGAGRGSLHPALLVTLVLPQLFGAAGHMADVWGPPSFAWPDTGLFIAQNVGILYVGALPLLLVAAGFATGRLWDREVRFYSLALMLMLLYALGWYTPVFRAMYELLPGVNLYRRPADAVFLVGALLGILAGYVTHLLFERPWEPLPTSALVAGGGVVVTALLFGLGCALRIDKLDRLPGPMLGGCLAFAAAAVALWWSRERIALSPFPAALGLALATAADLAWNNGPTTSSALPPAVYEVLEPATRNPTIALLKAKTVAGAARRDRVELAGLGFHWPNASMTHRLEATLGYNPVRLGTYSRATAAGDHVGLPDQRKFSPLMPSYRSLLADMLGLRLIATGAPIETMDTSLKAGDLPLLAETAEGHFIYENPRALPRVLLVPEARPADLDGILASGHWPPAFDPSQTVLLDRDWSGAGKRQVAPVSPTGIVRPGGTARIQRYANTEVVIDSESTSDGFVVLNDLWHPWWFAEIDGQPVPLLRANVLFRAVEVPAGTHRIVMRFRPLRGMLRQVRMPALQ